MTNINSKVVICSSPDNLEKALELEGVAVTVEAEYGDREVKGSLYSSAHHGPRAGNSAPCMDLNLDGLEPDVIGVSHFDLDTLGGVMRTQVPAHARERFTSPEAEMFWMAAEQVDIQGPHRLQEFLDENFSADSSKRTRRRLQAFWAWSQDHRLFPPRDGSVQDVTGFFEDAACVVEKLIDWIDCEDVPEAADELIRAGDAWAAAQKALDEKSYVREAVGGVRATLRKSEQFVNHLYRPGLKNEAIVGYNEKAGSVTLSFANPLPGVSAREIVQAYWGPKAGGRDEIAGSPRDQSYSFRDAEQFFEYVISKI